ncbi:MAG: trigger factor [Granulosicoccus sp.]|nr:trigger factor [Granulosicoccus sp.]
MQVSVETTQGLERRMTVALPSEDIDSAVLERLQSLSKTTRMNGFRPGKVPFKVVKKRYEPQVRSEVLGSMINRSYFDAVQQEKLRPAGQPDIVPGPPADDGEDTGFSFVATFEVYPEFDPVYNESITVKRPVVTIEQSDIDEMLENLRKQRTEYVAVERESADGDQIVIDFTGRMDGEEFDGGKAEKAPLVLGSNAMIPGFESQLLGMKAGESKTIQVTFPEDYQAEHLAGKDTEFDITVHEVKESRLPEFDEELVKSFGIEDGTVESLRADIRRNMERELKQRVETQVKSQVMDGLVSLNPIDVPSALVSEEIKRQREQLMQQMSAESDSSMLADELFTDQATRRVQLGLIIGEIIQREEIKADAAAVRDQIEQLASSYQDPQQVIDYYYGNPEMLKNIEGLVLEEAVTAAVLASATVVDDPTTFKDIMNPSAPAGAPVDSENS